MKIYNALSYSIASDFRYYGDCIRRALVSYWAIMSSASPNIKAIEEATAFHGALFLDSGGFSAFTKGVEIDIDHYISFIKRYNKIFGTVANLDVIGDHEASMKNQRYMESQGVNPIPVFHYGTDMFVLKDMAQEYPYIALGGLVPHARYKDRLRAHLDRCFSIIGPGVKTHLFGITSRWVLERYPAFSADSTSHNVGGRQGTVSCLFNNKKMNPKTDIKSFGMMDKDDTDKRYKERIRFMCLSTQKLEDYITALWAKRGITWTD